MNRARSTVLLAAAALALLLATGCGSRPDAAATETPNANVLIVVEVSGLVHQYPLSDGYGYSNDRYWVSVYRDLPSRAGILHRTPVLELPREQIARIEIRAGQRPGTTGGITDDF